MEGKDYEVLRMKLESLNNGSIRKRVQVSREDRE